MKKILLLSLCICWCSSAFAAPLIKTLAVVNNDVVTSYQLDQKLQPLLAKAATPPAEKELSALKKKLLNDLIEDRLVDQRIKELRLSVNDQELTSAIEDVQRQNKLTSDQLKTALRAQGMSYADYRKNLRKEILRYKLIAKEVRSKVEVTKAQIRAYFEEHKDDYLTKPSVHLVRVGYPISADASSKDRQLLKQKAEIVRQQLLSGKPFDEVKKALGPEAEAGDMGTIIVEEMNSELRNLIANLKVGEVNPPTEVLGSLYIFQVLARTSAKAELTSEVSQKIEKILGA